MNATVLWVTFLCVAILIEVLGRRHPRRVATLSRAMSVIARRVPGRVVLIVLWLFVGIHLFARYTIPLH